MSGFKTHDPKRQATSPNFRQGVKDGANDRQRAQQKPPVPEIGLDPDLDWSYMYREGYAKGRADV